MKALVTGGAGFIGSHLVERLVADGHDVLVVDDLSTGRRENLAHCHVDIVKRDLVTDTVGDLVSARDVIFHLAAVPSVPRSVREPLRAHDASATATLKLLLAARDAGVRTFVNSSSSSVYGNVARPPMQEAMATLPRSPYAVAKLAAEGYTRVFSTLFGMQTVSLRYFNVFGPRQDPNSAYAAAIPKFIVAYEKKERPIVFDDGWQSRDFTYVANVVDANLRAANVAGLGGESINVAAGEPRSVNELLRAIGDVFGFWLEPHYVAPRPGDIRDSHADISLARERLGYRPIVGFDQGLRTTIEWQRGAL